MGINFLLLSYGVSWVLMRVRATRYRSPFGGDDRRDKARWESWMMRQSSTASSACPSMEPQISSTSIDGNLSLRYHATDQCQMNFSFRLLLNFGILVFLHRSFSNFFSLT